MKILVAYDGTLSSKDVLRDGLKRVHDSAGEVIILQVFNRELLQYYDATPQIEEKLRSDYNLAATEAQSIVRQEGNGVRASIVQFDGNPERDVLRYAEESCVDMVLYPKTFTSLVKRHGAALRTHGIAVTPLALRIAGQCAK
jgi:hypothetical protein